MLDGKITRRHDAFGQFLKGSDLERYFDSVGIVYTKKKLPSPIYVKCDEQALDRVCHMLGFVIRYDPEDVKKCVADVEAFMARHKQDEMFVFPRDQDFFVLSKQ